MNSNLPKSKNELNAELDAALKDKRLARRAMRSGRTVEQEAAVLEKRASRKARKRLAKQKRAALSAAVISPPVTTHPRQSWSGPTDAAKKSFYASWDWRTLRMEVLTAQGHRCQSCGATPANRTVSGARVRLVVDHIKPLSRYWNLRLDKSNLQVLCDECNMGKGAWLEMDFRDDVSVENLTGDEQLDAEWRAIIGR